LLKTNQDFLEWFNEYYNTVAKQSEAEQLFTGENFSRAYNEVKEVIGELSEDFDEALKNNINNIINSIEKPKE